jgi:hypothetical protein
VARAESLGDGSTVWACRGDQQTHEHISGGCASRLVIPFISIRGTSNGYCGGLARHNDYSSILEYLGARNFKTRSQERLYGSGQIALFEGYRAAGH